MIQKSWKGKREFKKRVRYYAEKIDIGIKSLTIRPMRSKWASCSTDGNLNFNFDLLKLDKKIGNYVILHELLHFVTPNHGKLWKSYMLSYCSDYKDIEITLKTLE